MRFFITCDPANVRHIYTANYTNYPKGALFADTFDIIAGSLLPSSPSTMKRLIGCTRQPRRDRKSVV